jgi:hypothetical protein
LPKKVINGHTLPVIEAINSSDAQKSPLSLILKFNSKDSSYLSIFSLPRPTKKMIKTSKGFYKKHLVMS